MAEFMRHRLRSNYYQLELLATVVHLLSRNGLVVYRGQYEFLPFGSWSIEAGAGPRRLQIARDGDVRTISYAAARLTNTGAFLDWQLQEVVPLEVLPHLKDVSDWVAAVIRKHEAFSSDSV